MRTMAKPLIFISCGQVHRDEIDLGKAIEKFIRDETAFDAYFAEQQNTLGGLVTKIYGALDSAAGLIAVMHYRGEVTTPSGTFNRGSVWVEQEIAIASFLDHKLKRSIEVALYIQRGIQREGVRQQLGLAPVDFDTSDQVLADVRERIPRWTLKPRRRPVSEGPLREAENVAEIAEFALATARGNVENALVSTVFGEKAHQWVELQRGALEAAEHTKQTHWRVYRSLLDLRQAAQPFEGILYSIAEGLASGAIRTRERAAFSTQAEKLDEAIAALHAEIEKYLG